MNALRSALCVGATIAMLAGCGGLSGAPLSPSLARPSAALRITAAKRTGVRPATYGVIYSFKGGSGDGGNPYSGLIDVNGSFYGTTAIGGTKTVGTVFVVTASGSETPLHSFTGSRGGADPKADLAYISGTFYGTTTGGMYSEGTVFTYLSGKQATLHQFTGKDGATPTAAISHANGLLYGTTAYGGAYRLGTAFSISSSGREHVLHSFGKYGSGDGANPVSALHDLAGTLYGTTTYGGKYGVGTVYAIPPSGLEHVIYSFKGGPKDGALPAAGVINIAGSDGTLYGTTENGGVDGAGTVYAVSTSGAEHVVYSFQGGKNGKYPVAEVINVNGTFYGTTAAGGMNGKGTVFAISSSSRETVLHSFGSSSTDGAGPQSRLLNVNGILYGTTVHGGTGTSCPGDRCGTVFSISP